MAVPHLTLEAASTRPDAFTWTPPPSVLLPTGTVQGGAIFGAGVTAIETVTGRPARWASCQYLAAARTDEVVGLDVSIRAGGRSSSQASCIISAAGGVIGHVTAALGARDPETDGTWIAPPAVPAPDACPAHVYFAPGNGDLGDTAELRTAMPVTGDAPGRSALWARACSDATRLPRCWDMAIIGDFAPMVLRDVLGGPYIGTSIDNEVRIGQLVPCTWVLVDVTVTQVTDGFAHLSAHLWADDGNALLATVAQTCTLRRAERER